MLVIHVYDVVSYDVDIHEVNRLSTWLGQRMVITATY